MRRLTTATVPIASERQTGNIRKRKLPAAPTPAVAVAPSCPTKANTAAVPSALSDCSMIPGQASSSAARLGDSLASSAARALGTGASSSTSDSACWMLTPRRSRPCLRSPRRSASPTRRSRHARAPTHPRARRELPQAGRPRSAGRAAACAARRRRRRSGPVRPPGSARGCARARRSSRSRACSSAPGSSGTRRALIRTQTLRLLRHLVRVTGERETGDVRRRVHARPRPRRARRRRFSVDHRRDGRREVLGRRARRSCAPS